MKKVLIIGAGIHGCYVAKYLKDFGVKIFLIEKNKNICEGTSGSTHNRANRGFHYPRSYVTAKECKEGYNYFLKNYGNFLSKKYSYYCIEKRSQVRFKQYATFFNNLKIKYKIVKSSKFIKNQNIETSIAGEEGCFNHFGIKKMLKTEIKDKKINFFPNFCLAKIEYSNKIITIISSNGKKISEKFDFIINTTYDNSNIILKKFNNSKKLIKYLYKFTEVAVCRSKIKFPGITIMDGPFVTLMPYIGKKDQYLLYDVEHSIISKSSKPKMKYKKKTNFKKMKKKLSKYLNFYENLSYVKSLYGTRPVPIKDTYGDRSTKIDITNFKNIKIYTFREGKYISAPHIANKFVKRLWQQKIIKKKSP